MLPDGKVRWVLDSVMVSQEKNGILRLDGVITDITERKLTEQKLKEKEERFQAFMDNSPAVAFMKDENGRFIYYNRPFQRLFQRGEENLTGKTDADLFPKEIAQKLEENDEAVLMAGRTVETVERVPTPDGVTRDWLVFKFPLQEASGRRLLGGVAVEITDRRRLEPKSD
jgi:PAS domain S-box-containing protein